MEQLDIIFYKFDLDVRIVLICVFSLVKQRLIRLIGIRIMFVYSSSLSLEE